MLKKVLEYDVGVKVRRLIQWVMTEEQVRAEENKASVKEWQVKEKEYRRTQRRGCENVHRTSVALLFPSVGVVLLQDNPSQTAAGDRDQIEMTDWSVAQTLYHTHTYQVMRRKLKRHKRKKKISVLCCYLRLHTRRKRNERTEDSKFFILSNKPRTSSFTTLFHYNVSLWLEQKRTPPVSI